MSATDSLQSDLEVRQTFLDVMRGDFALANAIPGNDCGNCGGTGRILYAWKFEVCSDCQKCKKCDGKLNGHSSSVFCLLCTQAALALPPSTAVPTVKKETTTSKVPPINRAMEKKDDAAWARFADFLASPEGKKATGKLV
jgi:hypothetical protein